MEKFALAFPLIRSASFERGSEISVVFSVLPPDVILESFTTRRLSLYALTVYL